MGLQISELEVQGQGFKPLVHVTPAQILIKKASPPGVEISCGCEFKKLHPKLIIIWMLYL